MDGSYASQGVLRDARALRAAVPPAEPRVDRSRVVGASRKTGFLIHPVADALLLIFSPLLALGIGVVLPHTPLASSSLLVDGEALSPAELIVGILVAAHLLLVLVRSHGNRGIFERHPLRFAVLPPVLLLFFWLSPVAAAAAAVLGVWWDVYHSSLQTFGIARIYEGLAGNDATTGRRLDYWLNLLLYAGPVVAGVTFAAHLESFERFETVGVTLFSTVPAEALGYQRVLCWAVLGAGVPFLACYVAFYWRLHRRGHAFSWPKVALLASTGLCSIYTWGFNSFGQAFVIMNLFHALQYFAIVWWAERGNVVRRLGLTDVRCGGILAFLAVAAVCSGYGILVETRGSSDRFLYSAFLVVSLLHFWYDGFVWSVRRRDV